MLLRKALYSMPNFEQDRQAACRWAHDLLRRSSWAIVDVETVRLYGSLCEIGIVSPTGETLFHSLVNPECEVSEEARAKHGITDDELRVAPTLPAVWDKVVESLKDRDVLIGYNAQFDRDRLVQSATRYQLAPLSHKWQCAMKVYAQFVGVWNERFKSYKYQPLGGSHRAIGDCLATLGKLKEMAALYVEEAAQDA